MKQFFAVLFLIITPLANAKDYDIPEIGSALSLSSMWIPVDASIIKAHNDDMLRLRPQTTTRYILGFTRGKPPNGFYSSTDYLWIQRTPISNPPITPEQLTAMLPKTMTKSKPEFERLLKDKISSIDPGAAYYDARLGAVIYDSSPTFPDGSSGRVRAFCIMTKKFMIAVNAYSTPANADAVFEEVRGIVSTLNIKEDQKMPATWIDRLKQLLTQ